MPGPVIHLPDEDHGWRVHTGGAYAAWVYPDRVQVAPWAWALTWPTEAAARAVADRLNRREDGTRWRAVDRPQPPLIGPDPARRWR